MMEAWTHSVNAFVTLTYDDYHLPLDLNDRPILVKRELCDFLKALNRKYKRLVDVQLRYFAAGEYGEKSWRPHYHAIIFGYPPCAHGVTRRMRRPLSALGAAGLPGTDYMERPCCPSCDLLYETWGKGIIENQTVAPKCASYVAGYVQKKMTHADDPRLMGRSPEFGVMSLKPGIGHAYIEKILEAFNRNPESYADENGEIIDVPSFIDLDGKWLPLDLYIRNKMRVMDGRPKGLPEELQWRNNEALLVVQAIAKKNQGNVREEILSTTADKRTSVRAKLKLQKKVKL